MKRCPQCNRVEADDTLTFCRADGTALISASGSFSGDLNTAKFGSGPVSSEIETSLLPQTSTTPGISRHTGPTTALPATQFPGTTRDLTKPRRGGLIFATIGIVLAVIFAFGYFYLSRSRTTAIHSIAVMPFVNESANSDLEYLSDGMTETLISNLSQLPNLNVKARSSVFRYKGKETKPQTVGKRQFPLHRSRATRRPINERKAWRWAHRTTQSNRLWVADRTWSCGSDLNYAATGDGQRFLINASVESDNSAPLTIVLNWRLEP